MVIKLLTGMAAVSAASFILLQDHVFCRLDKRLQSLDGLYSALRSIESSFLFAALNETELQGVAWGYFETSEEYVNHSAFLRHSNAVAYSLLAEKELAKNFPDVRRIVGNIPETNRAALLYALRCGYAADGQGLNVSFINNKGESVPLIRMVKNIEV